MPMRTFRFSAFTLDVDNACVLHEGARLGLSPKDFALLHHLVSHRSRVVPHAELLQAVWRETAVGPDVLKVRVRRLRRILGDDAATPRFIASVHGEGYRFVAAVVSSPFGAEALPSTAPPRPPVIGREAELAQLQGLLREAASGRRRIVFVTGEPGIGKTTLIDEFAERSAPAAGVWIGRGQCIEHYGSGEPYLPVMEALGRLARTDAHERLEAVLRRVAPSWLLELPALVESQEREALHPQSPPATRERRMRELAEALETLTTARVAANDPPLLVLVLEDLHWTDPSTVELLTMLARRRDRARLMVVCSYRPVATTALDHPLRPLLHELRAHSAIGEIDLPPLTEEDVARYLDLYLPANAFSSEIASLLHQRTGGNPLFLTDVVRDLLAREVIVHGDAGWTFRDHIDAMRGMVPASVRHLVERQRDESSLAEQRLLEAASVAGLEFSAATLAAALARDTADIEEIASGLAERERFLRQAGVEEWPDGTRAARFRFVHALHRELWYERVPVSRRQDWHLRIAERKEAAYRERAAEIAAELAVHFEQGRDSRRAITYYDQASANALRRAANTEARAHLTRAFELLRELPDTRQRMPQELRLQLRLGTLDAVTMGYTSAGTASAFRRAQQICRQLGDAPELFDAVGGLYRFFLTKESSVARELGEQLIQIAEQSRDPTRLMVAHTALGQTLVVAGELTEALAHARHGLELSRTHWRDELLPVYGQHLGLNCAGVMATALLLLGHPRQASACCDELLEAVREDTHPFVSIAALWGAALFHQTLGDTARLLELADAVMRRSSAHPAPDFGRLAEVWRGWALVVQGLSAQGLPGVRGGVEALRAAGIGTFEPHALGLLADGHRRMGQLAEARAVMLQAFAAAKRNGPGWYDAELHRLDGEIRLDAAEAEGCFREALEVARRQEAKAWELRAAVSLGELWRQQGKGDRAQALVSQTYGRFTDGFDTPDLMRAQAFLEGCRQPVS